MEYHDDWAVRAVRGSGQMKWRGKDVMISTALIGERIGLEPQGDGHWRLWFGGYELGRFDERKGRVEALRQQPTKACPPIPAVGTASPCSAGRTQVPPSHERP